MGGLDLSQTPLAERLVLLGLADLAARGATPAHSHDVQLACRDCLGMVEDAVAGAPTEADVMRALNTLADGEVVTERRPDDASPVGKGRPVYDLAVEADALLDALAEPPLAAAVERLRE